jgi:hypothetical protein
MTLFCTWFINIVWHNKVGCELEPLEVGTVEFALCPLSRAKAENDKQTGDVWLPVH